MQQKHHMKLSVCCITYNEEKLIARCLAHIRDIAHEIIIMDSGSTDRTVEICKSFNAKIFYRQFDYNYAAQRNAAIEQVSCPWILMIDADEIFTTDALKFISKISSGVSSEHCDAYYFPRKNTLIDNNENIIPGKIKINYPDYQGRLFRSYVRYHRKIHEDLVGYKKRCRLGYWQWFFTRKMPHDLHIIHTKTTDRQKEQDDFYYYIDPTKYPSRFVREGRKSTPPSLRINVNR